MTCSKCQGTGYHASKARHEDGSGQPAYAVLCQCSKQAIEEFMSKPEGSKCDTCAHFESGRITHRCNFGYGGLHIVQVLSGSKCDDWKARAKSQEGEHE